VKTFQDFYIYTSEAFSSLKRPGLKKCCSSIGGTCARQIGKIASVINEKYFNEVIIFEPNNNFNPLYLRLSLFDRKQSNDLM
jgi:hypothetical protein